MHRLMFVPAVGVLFWKETAELSNPSQKTRIPYLSLPLY